MGLNSWMVDLLFS